MKKTKMLQVNKLYPPYVGGIERFVRILSEEQCKFAEVDALVCQVKGKKEVTVQEGVKVTRASCIGIYYSMPLSLQFLTEFRKTCNDYDVITLHTPFPLANVALWLSGYKGKVVFWWHSDIIRQKKLEFLYKPFLDYTLRRSDVVVAATEGHVIHSEYLSRFKEKCVIIPYPVEDYMVEQGDAYLEQKRQEQISQEQISHEQASQVEKVNFLYVGRLVYYKGCDYLLRAFKEANLSNATLTLVGDGVLYPELKAMVEEFGIQDKVIFLRDTSDEELVDEYKKCHVFVLPSVEPSEAFGIVQIEAMAFGKAVINTNLKSGVPRVGVHGVTGLTIEPRSEQELVEAMTDLYDNREKRQAMGMAGKQMVDEKYTSRCFFENIKETYGNLTKIRDMV